MEDLTGLRWARVDAPRQALQRASDKQTALQGRVDEARRTAKETRAALKQEIKEGFHERLAEAEERLHGLVCQREVVERRGRGLKLVRDLYRKRKEKQGQSLRAPFAKIVVPWLRHVTDERYEGIELDEGIMPVGLSGKRLGGLLPIESLSQGTREQTVLLVRLALACLVADERPFPVVLDDGLVNADRVRMEKMGLVLRQIAERGQLVVATCDPTRYDGLGARMIRL